MPTVGFYPNATRFPFQGTGAGLSISGSGRGCNELTGRFEVGGVLVNADGAPLAEACCVEYAPCAVWRPRAWRSRGARSS